MAQHGHSAGEFYVGSIKRTNAGEPTSKERFAGEWLKARGKPNIERLATRFKDVERSTLEKWSRNWSRGAGILPAALGQYRREWMTIVAELQRAGDDTVRPKVNRRGGKRGKQIAAEKNFAGELASREEYIEGRVCQVVVNRYERDRSARSACLKKHGYSCSICGMDFSERYGAIGEGFIHVHHLRPLALKKAEYRLNATKDLAPVCPNCHAMLHTIDPPLDIDELREIWHNHGGA
jgi:hypothetical protein